MKYTKTIICLANSRKLSGRCIAGKEIISGKVGSWIRPISNRPTGELSEEDRRYPDGQDAKMLDIIEIPMIEAKPHTYQSENHLIDAEYHWKKVRPATLVEVRSAIDIVKGPLWGDSSSSYNGTRDRVELTLATGFNDSLKLIEVERLIVQVAVEGAEFGNAKRKVRGRFVHSGSEYVLAITDPIQERRYLAGENGTFDIGKQLLCVSLGESYEGYAYKLIASIIETN